MNTLNVMLLFYFVHSVATTIGLSNLLGFYTGLRKLCLCRCGLPSNHISQVRNGRSLIKHIETPNSMPWLARIYTGSTTFRGTLISDQHVITAANPLYRKSASEITITLGANDLCKGNGHALNTSVEAILIHPAYSPIAKNNDIALLKLRNPVQFSDFVSPICMPLYDSGKFDQLAWTTSWLKAVPEYCITRISTLPILSSHNCHESNSSRALYDKGCLGPLGTKSILCENDIGGPVMTRWVPGSPFRLYGIVNSAMCDDNDVSPLFTRTIDNMIWIHEHIQNDCQCF